MARRRNPAGRKEAATLAGASVAIASRVLTRKGYASAAARARASNAAEKLSYRVDLRAMGPRGQSSTSVRLVIPNLLNASRPALTASASESLGDSGHELTVSSTRDDSEMERTILNDMISRDATGLINVPTASTGDLPDYFTTQQAHAGGVYRPADARDRLDTVVFEDINGSRAATHHLIDLGHHGGGYIGGDAAHSSDYDC